MSVTDAALSRLDRAQPARRHRARPRGHRGLRPAQLQLARRLPHRGRRGRHGDRGGRARSATSRSTTSATVINPMIVDGQVHGGIAQGVAQALYEEAVYDEDGNLATGSHGQLPRPVGRRAAELRARAHRDARARRTRWASRASARPGTIASPAAVMNAVVDALSPSGSPTSRCRPRPSASGGQSRTQRRRAMIPATFDYERAGSVDEAIALLGARRREAPRRRPLAPAAHEAAARAAGAARRHRPARRAVVRERRRRAARDRGAHAPSRPGERPARAGALPDHLAHGGAHRRPAGAPPRHDRRLGRPRRPRLRPAGRAARSRRRVRGARARAARRRSRQRISSAGSSRRRSGRRTSSPRSAYRSSGRREAGRT